MSYQDVANTLSRDGLILLDGGVGTELERRGVAMDANAWCGVAAADNGAVLEEIHLDYIHAGAQIITANTYASSRLMLEPAGFGDRFEEINRAAISAALRARDRSENRNVLIAGSLSHMCPMVGGTSHPDASGIPPEPVIEEALTELALFMRAEGCDLIILEMMYDPARMGPAFRAASACGLPVWAGFSARRGKAGLDREDLGKAGEVLGFGPHEDVPFQQIVETLEAFKVDAAGIMHTPSDLIGDAIALLRDHYAGPLMAYPDSGYFKMPQWQFEDVISPADFAEYASDWRETGVQIIGGCCGLSPEHISAVRDRFHAHDGQPG